MLLEPVLLMTMLRIVLLADCKNEEIILSLLKTLKEPVQIGSPNDLEHAVEVFSIAKKHNVKPIFRASVS
jgi:hypothetical protein